MSFLSPQWALLAGMLLSFLASEKISSVAKVTASRVLQISVVLLGASLNFHSVIQQGAEGLATTFFGITFVFILGHLGRRLLKVEKVQGLLITMGTAICGGSAIGALAPVLHADSMAITISIGVVFLLNSVAVFIFPPLGSLLSLTQDQFGTWAALAIHDTSSVVAASSIYGTRALEVATTIKLTRALWIVPVTLFFSFLIKRGNRKTSFPWFILGFIFLSLIFTFTDASPYIKNIVTSSAKLGFSLTLFLIGLTFNVKKIMLVGVKPLVFGTGLWVIVSLMSLFLIKQFS